jgi:hypothetical protein
MPSTALTRWRTDRLPQLATISRLAHAAADRSEADLLVRAYVLLLTAEFQGFFTDLLTDISQAIVDALPGEVRPPLRMVLRDAMGAGRLVDHRNPDATTVRRDLVRFDMQTAELLAGDRDARVLLNRLDQVIRTRNALAHGAGTVSAAGPGGRPLSTTTVDEWTAHLDRLAAILDKVVARNLSERLSVDLVTKEPV